MNEYGDLPLLEIQLELHRTWSFPMTHQEKVPWRKLQLDSKSAKGYY